MTWGGIGPKLALITLPYIILSVIVINRDPELLKINFVNGESAVLKRLFADEYDRFVKSVNEVFPIPKFWK